MSSVITRFAPSPTGYIHVGGVRTALFAWLIARQQNGSFILRIEDTDQQRYVKGSEQHIIDSLQWLGLEWNAGPDKAGPDGPYRQSERLAVYTEWAKKLVQDGKAYADPYSKEQLEEFRQDAIKNKKPFLYRNYRPENPPQWDGSQPLRLKSHPKAYTWHDAVLGDLSAGEEAVDDFILMKADGFPTYNFCHIVDDSEMGVTHIVRSQEFIASVPKFLNLYEALGVQAPVFVTLPPVMAMNGTKKLSKRDGAKDILDYAREGYLPEAMMNFLATLGWNDGTEQEIFNQSELIEKFTVGQIQKSPARFDEKRLLWMNGQWIRTLTFEDLAQRVEPFWPASAQNYDNIFKNNVLHLVKDRLKTLQDIPLITNFLFIEPTPDKQLLANHKQLAKLTDSTLVAYLGTIAKTFAASEDFSSSTIQTMLNDLLEQTGEKPITLFSLVRIATTWAPFSPDLAPSLELLGKARTLQRITDAARYIAADKSLVLY